MFSWSATRTARAHRGRIGRAVWETLEDRRLLSLAAPVAQVPTGSTLLWSNVAGESGYQIEYQLQGHENYHLLLDSQSGLPLNLAADTTSAAIPTPPTDHTYTFRVRALAPGESAYSNEVALATASAQQGGPVSGLSYVVEGGQHLLRFSNTSTDPSEYAALDLRNGQSAYPEAWQQGAEVSLYSQYLPLVPLTELNITNLVNGFGYATTELRIKILTSGQNFGKVSNTVVIPAPERALKAPVNLTQQPDGSGGLTLNWQNGDSTQPTSYQIFEAKTGAPVIPGAYVVGVLSPTVSYTFRPYELWEYPSGQFVVRATNGSSVSNFSNISTPTEAGPVAVGNLVAAPGDDEAEVWLTWDNLSSNEDGYRIERKPHDAPSTAWEVIGVSGSDATRFSDVVPDLVELFDYRVIAYNRSASSSPAEVESWAQARPALLKALRQIADEHHTIASELTPILKSLSDAATKAAFYLNIASQINLANIQASIWTQLIDPELAADNAKDVCRGYAARLVNPQGLVSRAANGRFVALAASAKTLLGWAGPAALAGAIVDWTADVLLTINNVYAAAEVVEGVSIAQSAVTITFCDLVPYFNAAIEEGNATENLIADIEAGLVSPTPAECVQLLVYHKQALSALRQWHQQQTPAWQAMQTLAFELQQELDTLTGYFTYGSQ